MKITISQDGKIPVAQGSVGLFLEDINYALDGGLSAQMLENRNFEAKNVYGKKDDYTVLHDGMYGWEPYPAAGSATLKIKTDRALFAENPHYMRVVASEPGAGMRNKAYDGLYLTKGVEYTVTFWLRSYDYRGKVSVSVRKEGAIVYERKVGVRADGKWRRYSVHFKAKADMDAADFVFSLQKAGMVHVDCFSMLPSDAVLGIFRRDLVRLLYDMKPGFLRFPGGCVVEGNTLANRYNWKESVGDPDRRRQNWNRWAVHDATPENNYKTEYSHYGQTLAIGFYEYFLLAELLGAKPLPVLSLGLACQYMSTEFVALDDPELESYIQDALDLVEFANGGEDTMWGKLRVELGHPAPFNLEYLALGNEQWEDAPVRPGADMGTPNAFHARFELFEQRIHERYPNLRLIGTAGPDVGTDRHRDAWAWTRKNLQSDPFFVYCTDEHFYMPPQWLYAHSGMYDNYPRDGLVFVGEFAAHVKAAGSGRYNAPESNSWGAALAEAAFMTGMERNADVVVMKAYAPLLARYGYTMWSPDLIWFNGRKAVPTPSYHVQKLYSLLTGDYALHTATDTPQVWASATERDGFVFVKAVNASGETLEADVEGDFPFGQLTRILRMEGDLLAYNTLEEPDKISPKEVAPTAPHSVTLPPHSFSVLVFR